MGSLPGSGDFERPIAVHSAEVKLIEFIRSIYSGELSTIKIQNGLPVLLQIEFGSSDLCEIRGPNIGLETE